MAGRSWQRGFKAGGREGESEPVPRSSLRPTGPSGAEPKAPVSCCASVPRRVGKVCGTNPSGGEGPPHRARDGAERCVCQICHDGMMYVRAYVRIPVESVKGDACRPKAGAPCPLVPPGVRYMYPSGIGWEVAHPIRRNAPGKKIRHDVKMEVCLGRTLLTVEIEASRFVCGGWAAPRTASVGAGVPFGGICAPGRSPPPERNTGWRPRGDRKARSESGAQTPE